MLSIIEKYLRQKKSNFQIMKNNRHFQFFKIELYNQAPILEHTRHIRHFI